MYTWAGRLRCMLRLSRRRLGLPLHRLMCGICNLNHFDFFQAGPFRPAVLLCDIMSHQLPLLQRGRVQVFRNIVLWLRRQSEAELTLLGQLLLPRFLRLLGIPVTVITFPPQTAQKGHHRMG